MGGSISKNSLEENVKRLLYEKDIVEINKIFKKYVLEKKRHDVWIIINRQIIHAFKTNGLYKEYPIFMRELREKFINDIHIEKLIDICTLEKDDGTPINPDKLHYLFSYLDFKELIKILENDRPISNVKFIEIGKYALNDDIKKLTNNIVVNLVCRALLENQFSLATRFASHMKRDEPLTNKQICNIINSSSFINLDTTILVYSMMTIDFKKLSDDVIRDILFNARLNKQKKRLQFLSMLYDYKRYITNDVVADYIISYAQNDDKRMVVNILENFSNIKNETIIKVYDNYDKYRYRLDIVKTLIEYGNESMIFMRVVNICPSCDMIVYDNGPCKDQSMICHDYVRVNTIDDDNGDRIPLFKYILKCKRCNDTVDDDELIIASENINKRLVTDFYKTQDKSNSCLFYKSH